MKIRARNGDNGNTLLCALCTIIVISLIGANVLVNCTRHYNITAKQIKAWKEALYAAEAGGDAALDELRKNPSIPNFTADGWITAPSPAPTPGPAWTKTFSNFGQYNSLSAIVTIDRLMDSTGTIPNTVPYYRIRAIGTAQLFGLPRVGLSDKFFTGGPNFVSNSANRGVGDTLLRKIDFKYDHFKSTYGDGDGNGVSLTPVTPGPQVTRRIELVAVPKCSVFNGAMRIVNAFNWPGSAGYIDSYSSTSATNPNPSSPRVIRNNVPGSGVTSYYGSNPSNAIFLKDAHDGDVSVGSTNFTERGSIWGDVTTNGGNVTHSDYQISGTIDNNAPFTVKPLWPVFDYIGDTSTYTSGNGGGSPVTATSVDVNNPTSFIYSSITGSITIKNGNAGTISPYAYAKLYVNGDITGKITIEKGVTAQIWFTGNLHVKGEDLDNQNVDRGTLIANLPNPGFPPSIPATPGDDPNPSRAGHLQFYGLAPDTGTQTINIDSPGNVYATFYAPRADITLASNTDIFSAVVGRSFSVSGGGAGNTGFHYDKALNSLEFPVVQDYQIASYVEDVR
jgi:hypothetical protein